MRLTSERVVVRDWRADDLGVYAHWQDGEREWMAFDGPYYARLRGDALAQHIERIGQKISDGVWPKIRRRVVIADRSTDVMLGTLSWYWESEETKWKSLGITLYDPKTWGVGLGCEAFRLWTTYLFEQDESLVRLGFMTWSGNVGMMKMGEKLGFVEEARFRKARIVDGEYFDSIGMGVLREEWFDRHPSG